MYLDCFVFLVILHGDCGVAQIRVNSLIIDLLLRPRLGAYKKGGVNTIRRGEEMK